MSDIVVDSCVATKLVLPEPDSAQASQLFADVTLRGDHLVVLDLAFVEITNAVWKQIHRGLIGLVDGRRALDKLLQTPVHTEAAHRLLRPGLEIAAKYGRSAYDALFVALTHDLGLPGVTADEPLYRAVHADFPQIVLLRDW